MECILKEKFCKDNHNCSTCNSRAKKLSIEMQEHPRLCAWINCKSNVEFVCKNKNVEDGKVPEGNLNCSNYKFMLD